MKIQGKIEFRWGDKNLETGEPIEGVYTEMLFEEEALQDTNEEFYKLVIHPSVVSALNNVKDRILGKGWFMKELQRKRA